LLVEELGGRPLRSGVESSGGESDATDEEPELGAETGSEEAGAETDDISKADEAELLLPLPPTAAVALPPLVELVALVPSSDEGDCKKAEWLACTAFSSVWLRLVAGDTSGANNQSGSVPGIVRPAPGVRRAEAST